MKEVAFAGEKICFVLRAVWILIEILFREQSQILYRALLSGVLDQLLNRLGRNLRYVWANRDEEGGRGI
jgi:hypothetical protein